MLELLSFEAMALASPSLCTLGMNH
jgi:hypothetical protein